MALVQEIIDRLVAQSVGVQNTNIFEGRGANIPTGPGPYLSVINTGGSGSNKTQDDNGTELFSAQLLTRASTQAAAMAMLEDAFLALGGVNGLYNILLSGVVYVSLKTVQNPMDVGVDATGKRYMRSFNVEGEKYPS